MSVVFLSSDEFYLRKIIKWSFISERPFGKVYTRFLSIFTYIHNPLLKSQENALHVSWTPSSGKELKANIDIG